MDGQTTRETCLKLGDYIATNNATIRETAAHFDIPKSTVYTLVTKRLQEENFFLYHDVREVLDNHIKERATRGAMARHANSHGRNE